MAKTKRTKQTISAHYRQGDVLVRRVERRPETATKQADCVLALGEVTGHSHRIDVSEAFCWVDADGTKYVEVYGESAALRHEEHGTIHLPGPAMYRVVGQREYAPEGIRDVTD